MDLEKQVASIVHLRGKAIFAAQGAAKSALYRKEAAPWWRSHLAKNKAKWLFMPGYDAYLGCVDGPHGFYKVPVREIHFDYDKDNPKARRWLLEHFAAFVGAPSGRDLLKVHACYKEMLPVFFHFGYHISEVVLGGSPKVAFEGLKERYRDDYPLPGEFGLTTRVLGPEDAGRVIALEKQVFKESPEHCWFFHNPGFAEKELERLKQVFAYGESCFGLFKEDRLLGYFGYAVKRPAVEVAASAAASAAVTAAASAAVTTAASAAVTTAASAAVTTAASAAVTSAASAAAEAALDLAFDKQIQQKKLSIYAYKTLLKAMINAKVESFTGGTANKSVLQLAGHMKRPLLWYSLRHKSLCQPLDRFENYL